MAGFSLGNHQYRTKGEAVARVRKILHDATIDGRLCKDDELIVLDLLSRHPNQKEKTRYGVAGLTVRLNAPFFREPNRGFYILRPDGGEPVSFSYMPGFGMNIKVADTVSAAKEAMRGAVSEWVNAHKDRLGWRGGCIACPGFSGPCQYESVMTRLESHVHHEEPSFNEIAEAYIESFGTPKTRHKSIYGFQFVDAHDLDMWVSHHNEHARLKVICVRCHKDAHAAKPQP